MAAPAAYSAAVGTQVPQEPTVPVRARRVLLRQPVLAGLLVLVRQRVLADLQLPLAVPVPAHLAVLVHLLVPADPLREERPVLAHLLVHPAGRVDLLLSLQSFSAAMAGSTP